MDLIIINGQLHTMTEETGTAIAIKDGRIQFIGSDRDALALKTSSSIIIDAKEENVLPGFNDSHVHLLGYGQALMQVNLTNAKSIEDVISITKAFIEKNNLDDNTWVLGRGWNQDNFSSGRMPTHKDLDAISDSHFIFLRRACGHVGTGNSNVLSLLDLDASYHEIEGGEINQGIFKENAIELVMNSIPEPSAKELKKAIRVSIDALHKMGITSVQSDDLCVLPIEKNDLTFKVLTEMAEDKTLNIRVYEQSLFRTLDNFKTFIAKDYKLDKEFNTFRFGPLKVLGDGSLGGRTAWMSEKYADGDTYGIHMYSQEELDALVLEAQKNNISVAIHCIGDAMLDSALESIQKAQKIYENNSLKHGIVHCQISRIDQLEKMKALNVLAYVQPIFLDYDCHIVEDRVGPDKAKTSYNWKTMMDMGIPIAFGSDAPVETPDPLKGIHCAITRQDLKGQPEKGYLKEQALTIKEALYYYTAGGAYTSNEETYKGKLQQSYLADIIIVKGDINNPINCHVTTTIFNGEIVYKK